MCDVVLVLHRLDEIYQGVKNYILIFFIEVAFFDRYRFRKIIFVLDKE